MRVPDALSRNCAKTPERRAWLGRLPEMVDALTRRWKLELGEPFAHAGDASWVNPVTRADGTPAVLKLGMPHFEADHEAAGLRFWNGDPTVHVLESDDQFGAMLLERCLPGIPLSARPEPEQDEVLAECLRALWSPFPDSQTFRPLAVLIEAWIAETRAQAAPPGSEPGITALRAMIASTPREAMLATDLHAGNVVSAQRKPWLVIDPNPFVGDPAYDATQHLLNCPDRMAADPLGTVARYAELLDVDRARVSGWMFARLAAEPRADWGPSPWDNVAATLRADAFR